MMAASRQPRLEAQHGRYFMRAPRHTGGISSPLAAGISCMMMAFMPFIAFSLARKELAHRLSMADAFSSPHYR